MSAAVRELEKTTADEVLELRLRLRDLRARNATSQILIHDLQVELDKTRDEMGKMRDTYIKNLLIDRARMDVLAAQLTASCQMGDSVHGPRRSLVAAATLQDNQHINSIFHLLAEQVERSERLQVHGTNVTCHCTHTMINGNIKKLAKRAAQVRCDVSPL
ncbi:hypothetical protein NEMBOFW57_008275 [Staphylotrichum longicolle]|uniref:Uncharacterized protein n=1 Tax=Staphylotrichum longicolle TaxID=669026 RepID=A0AAD4HU05_9PEZI|nr:hypothetical protein NEMBOFW57_008275 [Staphylotrichum longicolle]